MSKLNHFQRQHITMPSFNGLKFFLNKHFFKFFFSQVLSVKNFLYRYCKNYLGKLDSPDYKVIVSSRESCRLNTPPGTPSNSVDKNDQTSVCSRRHYLSTVFPHIVSALEQFPPLNSFRTCMYCYQRSQYIRLNSKKHSFRGNYSRKYGRPIM